MPDGWGVQAGHVYHAAVEVVEQVRAAVPGVAPAGRQGGNLTVDMQCAARQQSLPKGCVTQGMPVTETATAHFPPVPQDQRNLRRLVHDCVALARPSQHRQPVGVPVQYRVPKQPVRQSQALLTASRSLGRHPHNAGVSEGRVECSWIGAVPCSACVPAAAGQLCLPSDQMWSPQERLVCY